MMLFLWHRLHIMRIVFVRKPHKTKNKREEKSIVKWIRTVEKPLLFIIINILNEFISGGKNIYSEKEYGEWRNIKCGETNGIKRTQNMNIL